MNQQMQHKPISTSTEIPADFTSIQIALLNEIRDKAIATVRKEGVKMSEINSALNVLIKVEKQFFLLTHRRIPGQKSKKSRHEPASILPFTPTEESDPSLPDPAELCPEVPLPFPPLSDTLESLCDLKQKGYRSESCRGCIRGECCINKQ